MLTELKIIRNALPRCKMGRGWQGRPLAFGIGTYLELTYTTTPPHPTTHPLMFADQSQSNEHV